jgi:drug/metabolite transporter (DMT)-like permease
VTQALARAMLGEPLLPSTLLGGAAILLGVYLVSRARIRSAVPAGADA